MRRGKKTPENSTKIIFGSFSTGSLDVNKNNKNLGEMRFLV
jgi:hypothetical protein